jgi:hypothetical protein
MSSFFAQLMSPGGGIMLIPFIRGVIMCLFLTTIIAFVSGFARVHMAVLGSLAGGLLLSISFFMSQYEKVLATSKMEGRTTGSSTAASSSNSGERAKTD